MYYINQRVIALMDVTEDGTGIGDPDAVFPSPSYIHARKGEFGRVVHINTGGQATVAFKRGTATLVSDKEVTPVGWEIQVVDSDGERSALSSVPEREGWSGNINKPLLFNDDDAPRMVMRIMHGDWGLREIKLIKHPRGRGR